MDVLIESYKNRQRLIDKAKWEAKHKPKKAKVKKIKAPKKKKPPKHTKTSNFYKSWEWKKLIDRYENRKWWQFWIDNPRKGMKSMYARDYKNLKINGLEPFDVFKIDL